jgi:hypothetical protein
MSDGEPDGVSASGLPGAWVLGERLTEVLAGLAVGDVPGVVGDAVLGCFASGSAARGVGQIFWRRSIR